MTLADHNSTGNGAVAANAKKAHYSDPSKKPSILRGVFSDNVPAEMRSAAQWVTWGLVWKDDKNGGGKWDKPPKDPKNGRGASSTDPGTWASFNQAIEVQETCGEAGIGFVFSRDDQFCGIDLDNALSEKDGLKPWAKQIITELDSYTEVSPSTTGVKLFVRATLPEGCKHRIQIEDGEIEVYDRGRYFTVTGRRIPSSPATVNDRQEQLDTLLARLGMLQASPAKSPTTSKADDLLLDDQQLVTKAMAAQNGPKFSRLWNGDAADYGGDESRADLALCSMLAFWTRDASRIASLFKASGLYREKWDREDYRARTIAKALEGQTEQYSGRSQANGEAQSVNGHVKQAEQDAQYTAASMQPPAWPSPPGDAAFTGLAGRFVRAVEPGTEADPTALLVQLMVAFGNAVGRSAHFRVEADYHYANENVLLAGKTAKGRKGTSFGWAIKRLEQADPEWHKERIVTGVSSGEGILWSIRDPIISREKIKEPGKGGGVRFEEVQSDAGVTDKRLLIYEPEFATVLKQTERQGNTVSAILRQAWDGAKTLRTLTKNSPACATGGHVSIIGHITIDELHRCLSQTESANGFANRFLFVCTERSKILPEGGQADEMELARVQEGISEALAFSRTMGEVKRSAAARELWAEVYGPLSEGKPGMVGSLLARAEAHVMRLALIYALLDCSYLIELHHLQAGLALWDYCERSARYIFGDSLGDPVADELLRLLRACPAGLTRTDIRDHFQRHATADRIGKALGLLLQQNLARMEHVETGGRRSERWYAR